MDENSIKMGNLSHTDALILSYLQADDLKSPKKFCKQHGITPQQFRRRKLALEQAGIIRRYYLMTAYEKLGMHQRSFFLKGHARDWVLKQRLPMKKPCYNQYDITGTIAYKTLNELHNFIQQCTKNGATSFELKTPLYWRGFGRNHLRGSQKKEAFSYSYEPQAETPLDDEDKHIFQTLQDNPQASIAALSRRTNIPRKRISRKLAHWCKQQLFVWLDNQER